MPFFFICFLFLNQTFAQSLPCSAEKPDGPFLSFTDFKWGQSLEELLQRFSNLYPSNKRLKKRAFWDLATQQYYLPFNSYNGGAIRLSPRLIQSVTTHIEQGFESGVIDAVFFSDMGHSHFLIPQNRYDQIYDHYEIKEFSRMYEQLFEDPTIKILYHTAEQLKTRDSEGTLLADPRIQFRFKTRNLVGTNSSSKQLQFLSNPKSPANTVIELEGYRYWGAGFNVSAHKDGCFQYKVGDQTWSFDLSMYDLESEYSGD